MKNLALPASARMGHSLEMIQRALQMGEDTIILPLNFTCNSRCRFCIIETEIDARFDDTQQEVFERLFAYNAEARQFARLTISGAESTLHPALPDIASAATSRGGFATVRIQTNARRLRDRALTERLIACGIREYFVSIHAHTAALDAYITRSSRSFSQMQEGVGHLVALGARVISNTVVSADNAAHLDAIAAFILGMGIRELQFWSFLEIGEEAHQADQLVSLDVVTPALRAALDRVEQAGATAVVKWIPRCVLGPHGDKLDNHQPPMLMRDEFQDRLSDNFGFDCIHAHHCRWFGRGCDGLHASYRRVFGDEATRLSPTPLLAGMAPMPRGPR